MALRMPISRVRSVTETSMMFMMPIPPTSSEMPAMLASRMVMVSETVLAASAMSVCELTLKSSAVVPRCLFCSRLRISS